MNFSETFCRNIRFLRRKHGMTKKQMASILGVSPGLLSRMESGLPARIHTGHLCRACDYFEITADEILRKNLDAEGEPAVQEKVLPQLTFQEI